MPATAMAAMAILADYGSKSWCAIYGWHQILEGQPNEIIGSLSARDMLKNDDRIFPNPYLRPRGSDHPDPASGAERP